MQFPDNLPHLRVFINKGINDICLSLSGLLNILTLVLGNPLHKTKLPSLQVLNLSLIALVLLVKCDGANQSSNRDKANKNNQVIAMSEFLSLLFRNGLWLQGSIMSK